MSIDVLRDTLRRLLKRHWPLEQSAELGRSAASLRQLWQGLTELGFTSLGSPDTVGLLDTLAIIRDLGACNCTAPLIETTILNRVLAERGPPWLELLRSGDAVPAWGGGGVLAVTETSFDNPNRGRVRGSLDHVEILAATHVVALARLADGCLAVSWTDLSASTVVVQEQTLLHEARLARLEFTGTPGEISRLPEDTARRLSSLWRLCLCARATGAALGGLDLALEHARQRRQFGSPIGSFQAIQHKLANIRIAIEGARLTQDIAASAYDAEHSDWPFRVEAAIASSDPALRQCALETLHALGAIGYSQEHPATRHFRRIHLDLARANADLARARLCDMLWSFQDARVPEPDLGACAEQFRLEVREWLRVHWNATDQAKERDRAVADQGFDKRFSRKLGQRGWLALTWPSEYGGQQRSRFELLALIQETSRVLAPTLSHLAATYLVAPALLVYGSDCQKAQFLPRIARGELCISLGYSEPEAGSDLASLRTRATRTGKEFVITGQKMWGSTTDQADYVWLAARTDPDAPRHAGISVFLVPLNTPGITIRPHTALHGKTFSTQIFDAVRVPETALVGTINQGWKIITGALADERILMACGVAEVGAALAALVRFLRKRGEPDALTRNRMGAVAAEICVANALLRNTVAQDPLSATAQVAAAIAKTYSAELMERFAQVALDLAGPGALVSAGEPGTIVAGEIDRLLRYGPMHVIGGGTNEIQRSLIAHRGLDLPR